MEFQLRFQFQRPGLMAVSCASNASNGNYLGFDYNAAGYVIDAYTSDGEETSYQYDDFGDLVGVTPR